MGYFSRFLGAAAFSAIACGCVAPSGGDWSAQVLMGTTQLGDTYADFLSARYAGMSNDPEAAALYYEDAWAQSGDDPDLLDRTVVSMLLAGDAEGAGRIAREADGTVLYEAPFAVLTAAADYVAEGRRRQGIRLLEEAELGAMAGIGDAVRVWLVAERDREAAIEVLTRTTESPNPANGYGECLKAALLSAGGDDEAALEAFDRGFSVCARLPTLAAAHVRTANSGDGPERAQALVRRLPPQVAGSVEVRVLADALAGGEGLAPYRPGTREGAALGLYIASSAAGAGSSGQLGAVFFQLMDRLDPDADFPKLLLADSHFSLERFEAALAYAGAVDAASIYRQRAQWEETRALLALKREDAALEALRRLASWEMERDIALRVGDAFRMMEMSGESEPIYTRLIAAGGGDWRPLFGRAAAFSEMGDWERAEADLLAALELDPDQPDVLNFLGYSWIDRGENVEAGFDLIRRAIAQRPRAGYIVDSLGWAHYRLGQYEDAARELERAAELSPNNAEIIDHLGDAYWRTGRRLEAGFEWRRALTLDPEADLAATIRTKLDVGLGDDIAGGMAEAAPVRR